MGNTLAPSLSGLFRNSREGLPLRITASSSVGFELATQQNAGRIPIEMFGFEV